jgi:hypothetical protein
MCGSISVQSPCKRDDVSFVVSDPHVRAGGFARCALKRIETGGLTELSAGVLGP